MKRAGNFHVEEGKDAAARGYRDSARETRRLVLVRRAPLAEVALNLVIGGLAFATSAAMLLAWPGTESGPRRGLYVMVVVGAVGLYALRNGVVAALARMRIAADGDAIVVTKHTLSTEELVRIASRDVTAIDPVAEVVGTGKGRHTVHRVRASLADGGAVTVFDDLAGPVEAGFVVDKLREHLELRGNGAARP